MTIAGMILCLVSMAVGQDLPGAQPMEPDVDFSPMLFLFALAAIAVMVLLAGLGIMVILMAILCVGLLIALGIVSSSACLAMIRRRFSTGLRAFHYQLCAVAMVPPGVAVFWLTRLLFEWPWGTRGILLMGCLSGLFGGLLMAFALDRVVVLAFRRIFRKKDPEAEVQEN